MSAICIRKHDLMNEDTASLRAESGEIVDLMQNLRSGMEEVESLSGLI